MLPSGVTARSSHSGVYGMAYDGAREWAQAPGAADTEFGSGLSDPRDLVRQNIFGVDDCTGVARGQHWRERPPALATADACVQTFARLTWALRYYCVPCWDAFVELDEDSECARRSPCVAVLWLPALPAG
eukprot:COSAG02_NODE_611_length_19555_cov_34.449270_4_plen_130_part_00